MRRIELVDDQTIGITFPYNEKMIEDLKGLENRRWNAQSHRWEVHLSHLMEVVAILHIDPRNVPRNILRTFEQEWKNAPTRLRIGNAITRISGNRIPIEEIDRATSFRIEGADHSVRYKRGEWDGLRHLFQTKGDYQFPTGILAEVMHVLKEMGITYEVEDERIPAQKSLRLKPKGTLRDYQEEVLNLALGAGRGVIQMATGAGKTVLAAHLIARLGVRCIFFVHTKDLLYQAQSFLEEILGIPIGRIGDGKVELGDVTVATVQTVSRGLDRAGIQNEWTQKTRVSNGEEVEAEVPSNRVGEIVSAVKLTEAVFFDECHHLPAETCFGIALETDNACYRYGLSATPYRSDRMDMLIQAAVGETICKVDCSDLIEKGHLVQPHIQFHPVAAGPAENGDTYHRVYQREVVRNQARNERIARLALQYQGEGKTVLVLVNQVRHGQVLKKLVPDAVLLTGQDPSEFRNRVLHDFRERRQKIVIATTLADEGLDIPSLDVLILAGAGKSETKALQRIGRALRKDEGKEGATVIDFMDGARFLDEHSRRRLDIYRTEKLFTIELMESGEGEKPGKRKPSPRKREQHVTAN